jgi:hypothetical protein
MPWEVTIKRLDGAPLGDLASVRQQITNALPAIQFYRVPSGLEKIAAARAAGVEFPDIIRQHLEGRPATEQAEFEGDGFLVTLYGFRAESLDAIYAEVRGDGNPVPVLAALCRPNEWVAIDGTCGQPVDMAGASASGWEAFRAYRDRIIRDIQT